jgi:hypothetical protein
MSEIAKGGDDDKHRVLREWVELQRKILPLDMAIEQLRSRLLKTGANERDALEYELYALLIEEGREDEALHLFDAAIAQRPKEVLAPGDGWLDRRRLNARDDLTLVDFALERARRSGTWVRSLLGSKAWDFVWLRRGEELGQVLDQIVAHEVRSDVPDIGRERHFVDASPPGLIPQDIRARYDVFCPKRPGDVPFPSPEFEWPEWGPNGEEILSTHPRADAIDRTVQNEHGEMVPTAKTSVSADEIDRVIFSRLAKHGTWRKTVAVIGWVVQHCEERQLAIADYDIFERILQLVADGKLESQGNLSLWRYSEVRLLRDSSAR